MKNHFELLRLRGVQALLEALLMQSEVHQLLALRAAQVHLLVITYSCPITGLARFARRAARPIESERV